MAPHSSTLAWKIPWTKEPGGLQSMGSWRVRHDWATSLSLFTFMYWRRQWQPTPVFLPGESQGWRSLVGCRLWGRTESDTAEATQQQQQQGVYNEHMHTQLSESSQNKYVAQMSAEIPHSFPLKFPEESQRLVYSRSLLNLSVCHPWNLIFTCISALQLVPLSVLYQIRNLFSH